MASEVTDMAVRWLASVLVAASLLVCVYGSSGPANVVLLLTDDQDLLLGGTTPMSFTKALLQVTLEHSVASTQTLILVHSLDGSHLENQLIRPPWDTHIASQISREKGCG